MTLRSEQPVGRPAPERSRVVWIAGVFRQLSRRHICNDGRCAGTLLGCLEVAVYYGAVLTRVRLAVSAAACRQAANHLIVFVCVIVTPSLPAVYSDVFTLARCSNDPPRPAELKRRTLQSCGRLAFSGVCLAMHVGSWIWGIQVRLTSTASKQARLLFQVVACCLAALYMLEGVVPSTPTSCAATAPAAHKSGARLPLRLRHAAGDCRGQPAAAQAYIQRRSGRHPARRRRRRGPDAGPQGGPP